MFQKKLTRRDFLTGTAMAAAGAMITACAPKAGAVQPTDGSTDRRSIGTNHICSTYRGCLQRFNLPG